MFNSYYIGGDTTNNKCEVHLNQPSTGFIQKSNPVSRFIRFQRGSEIEKLLFPTDPREIPKLTYVQERYVRAYKYNGEEDWTHSHYEKDTKEKEVVVLQVCIFGDDYMLAEYVFKEDLKDGKRD